MKTRIIGSVIIALVLLGLYVATESTSTPQTTEQPVSGNNDSAMKSLSIN